MKCVMPTLSALADVGAAVSWNGDIHNREPPDRPWMMSGKGLGNRAAPIMTRKKELLNTELMIE